MKNKNMNIKSYTGINYKDLLSKETFSKRINTSLEKVKNQSKSIPHNYEEVNDYSFLNVVTEEITSLESVHNDGELKEILKDSLVDVNSNLYKYISTKEINNFINSFNSSEGKVLLHNVENISYLEVIDQVNENSYKLHISHEGYFEIDNNSLDSILTYLIENNNHKG